VLKAAFGDALAARQPKSSSIRRCLASPRAIAVAAGLVAAFAPAWQLTGRDANDALKMGPGRGNSSSGDGKVRNLLVVSEVALALMLARRRRPVDAQPLEPARGRSRIRCRKCLDRIDRYSGSEVRDTAIPQSIL
jgi:hypothetical protein